MVAPRSIIACAKSPAPSSGVIRSVSARSHDRAPGSGSPTESTKPPTAPGEEGDSTQDLVDHMRDMESSGRIDMDAFRGEPNHDDEDDTYGAGHDPDEEE